jgi:hypothetical protein
MWKRRKVNLWHNCSHVWITPSACHTEDILMAEIDANRS